jgi:N-acetylmuramoyl-L-alanine amidase
VLVSLTILSSAFPALSSSSRPPGHSPSDPKPAVRLDPEPARPDATRPSPPAARQGGDSDALRPGERAVFGRDGEPVLQARVPPGGVTETWLQGYIPDDRARDQFKKKLGSPPPAAGDVLAIALSHLAGDARVRVLGALFPGSGPRDGDWVHRTDGEGHRQAIPLERVAAWYTGRAANGDALAQRNRAGGQGPRPGQEIVIPHALLLPEFAARATVAVAQEPAHPVLDALPPQAKEGDARTQAPAAGTKSPPDANHSPEDDFTEAPAAAEDEEEPSIGAPGPYAPPPVAEGADDLKYGGDSEGRYAVYRLKKGEALYSAVVVRYTGRVDVQDVNDLAGQIARRSGIDDVTNIAIGYKVKIPLDDLLPEYMPRDDARRQAWERKQAQVARYTNDARSRDLEGVAVILDAGHGGRDIGASHNGVGEHDYVYDILCRVKAVLEKRTRAKVLPTIRDAREGWTIHESERLVRNRAEVLLTDPPFHLNDSVSSVNMRWYLSNAWYRKLVGQGFDPFKVVFTSIHADARHPSLAGAMVYVPGEEYRRGRYGSAGEVYTRYREARQEPFVSFTRAERERSEGLSRQFAAMLIDSFNDRAVGVQPFEPVRERIIRRGRAWVPAVLRCNVVPVETLIEVSNLSNPGDARAIRDPAYRQRVAEAYVEGLMRYFAAPSAASNGARATGTRPQVPGK